MALVHCITGWTNSRLTHSRRSQRYIGQATKMVQDGTRDNLFLKMSYPQKHVYTVSAVLNELTYPRLKYIFILNFKIKYYNRKINYPVVNQESEFLIQ